MKYIFLLTLLPTAMALFPIKVLYHEDMIRLGPGDTYDIIKKNYIPGQILYIDTDEGDVYEVINFIDFIVKNNVSCYAKNAYGLAFNIYNFCKERYFSYDSEFYKKDISISCCGEKTLTEMEHDIAYFKYVKNIFDENEAKRFQLDLDHYKSFTQQDYFLKDDPAFFQMLYIGEYYGVIQYKSQNINGDS